MLRKKQSKNSPLLLYYYIMLQQSLGQTLPASNKMTFSKLFGVTTNGRITFYYKYYYGQASGRLA